MFDLAVLGVGPRGLSVAKYAIERGLSVVMIDDQPLASWRAPNIIPDLEMRSPSTFDLFTYLPDMYEYSLNEYMELNLPYSASQYAVETQGSKVDRATFEGYLKHIFQLTLQGAALIRERVNLIDGNKIRTTFQTIEAKNIVVAFGGCNLGTLPKWIAKTELKQKEVKLSFLLSESPTNKRICVIGSGQGAAEVTERFAHENTVYWITKADPKVTNYPLPTWTEWGPKTGLGGFYRRIQDWPLRLKYLQDIKAWQPSITPYIHRRLQRVSSNIVSLTGNNTSDFQEVLDDIDYIIVMTGLDPDYKLIPTKDPIESYSFMPNFPKLSQGFRTTIPNIHVTGVLAIPYDGPRQGSFISAGLTSKEIIDSILNV
jgi:thioredoxin reductase